MNVLIHWTALRRLSNMLWDVDRCLYVYLHPQRDQLLYVGKADYCTVRQRMRGDHKDHLFYELSSHYKYPVGTHPRVLQGDLELPIGQRFSSALLHDIESLLIRRLDPWGNINRGQHWRPGLQVDCVGVWPLRRSRFRDS